MRNSNEPTTPIEAEIKKRERMLLGVYQQIAVHFADLHDTPGRMKAKGVIRRQVKWAESRTYFFWRLRRRLIEFEYAKSTHANSRRLAIKELETWFISKGGDEAVWNDDKMWVQWLEEHRSLLDEHMAELLEEFVAEQLTASFNDIASDESISIILRKALGKLPEDRRAKFLAAVKQLN